MLAIQWHARFHVVRPSASCSAAVRISTPPFIQISHSFPAIGRLPVSVSPSPRLPFSVSVSPSPRLPFPVSVSPSPRLPDLLAHPRVLPCGRPRSLADEMCDGGISADVPSLLIPDFIHLAQCCPSHAVWQAPLSFKKYIHVYRQLIMLHLTVSCPMLASSGHRRVLRRGLGAARSEPQRPAAAQSILRQARPRPPARVDHGGELRAAAGRRHPGHRRRQMRRGCECRNFDIIAFWPFSGISQALPPSRTPWWGKKKEEGDVLLRARVYRMLIDVLVTRSHARCTSSGTQLRADRRARLLRHRRGVGRWQGHDLLPEPVGHGRVDRAVQRPEQVRRVDPGVEKSLQVAGQRRR